MPYTRLAIADEVFEGETHRLDEISPLLLSNPVDMAYPVTGHIQPDPMIGHI